MKVQTVAAHQNRRKVAETLKMDQIKHKNEAFTEYRAVHMNRLPAI